MNTKDWGPPMWVSLHTITFGYPENPSKQDKKNYKEFFWGLQYVLPCSYCRDSYAKFIKCIPIDDYLGSRTCLTYWMYLIHDQVNKKLGTTSPLFEKVQDRYERMRAGNKQKIKRLDKKDLRTCD